MVWRDGNGLTEDSAAALVSYRLDRRNNLSLQRSCPRWLLQIPTDKHAYAYPE
jgi:hypothetical protein